MHDISGSSPHQLLYSASHANTIGGCTFLSLRTYVLPILHLQTPSRRLPNLSDKITGPGIHIVTKPHNIQSVLHTQLHQAKENEINKMSSSQGSYIRPPSIGHKMGIMFGFIGESHHLYPFFSRIVCQA